MHPFLKSCHFQPLASFWSHNLASWIIYISTSLKLLLHAWQKKHVHCCYLPLSSTICKNIHTQFPWPSYMLSSGSNIIFLLITLAELVFKKVFFFRFKQFILYLLFRLVHRRQNLSNCQKCELGQSRKQELTGRLQPKQGCQSNNLTKEIVSRQAVKSCLDKTTASDCWSSVSLSQPLSHLI